MLFLVLFAVAVDQESTSASHVVSRIAGGYEVTFSDKPLLVSGQSLSTSTAVS